MGKRDIVVIGASAGGIYALRELVAALPADFPASLFVVQHVSADSPSRLPEILNYAGKLKAIHPTDGESIQQGYIYIAPPDHHLLLEHDHVLVRNGPKENRFRPSIDTLFRSAAYRYGPRVIGVILTGALDDGTSGMWSVKRLGGVSVIQEPQEAMYPSMPENVRQHVEVDYTVPLADMASLLGNLVQEETGERPVLSSDEETRMSREVNVTKKDNGLELGLVEVGQLTPFTCPECHGTLVRIQEGQLLRYRCHTGHGFTTEALLSGVKQTLEDALWNAIRALEEMMMLLEQVEKPVEVSDLEPIEAYQTKLQQARNQLNQLRSLVVTE
ncbi:chemotaxis protein CheB [uncultured Fibrella sp.]|uniref:chemotaxis protein CheB n=1 Tax=uncultured Fibrella sp. TaxID=1284596 RepID=UPI0035CA3CCD